MPMFIQSTLVIYDHCYLGWFQPRIGRKTLHLVAMISPKVVKWQPFLISNDVDIRDVMKFAFEFYNVQTSNVFSRFEIRQIFARTHRRIWISGLHDWHHMSTPTGHRNNQLNKYALPNSLKGPKIILDVADHHVSKDGPFRILGSALTYLLADFFCITFLHFYHRHVNVWSNLHSNGFVLWNLHSTTANFLGFVTWHPYISFINIGQTAPTYCILAACALQWCAI